VRWSLLLTVLLTACGVVERDDAGGGDADADSDSDTDADTDSGAGVPTCIEQYGEAEGFVLCSQEPYSCRFVATLSSEQSCFSVCADHGGRCVSAYWVGSDDPCTGGDGKLEASCEDTSQPSARCDCLRGCEDGPACTGGLECTYYGCQ